MSFRHHLTSLSAVLLALAVGILVGSATLGTAGGTTGEPGSTDQALRRTRAAADDFARQVAPALVKGSLTGEKVLVVLTPDAGTGEGAREELAAAGATVTGQVRLRGDLLDESGEQTIDDVVAAVVPPGLALPETSALDRAGAELASVLLTSSKGTDASPAARQRVLGGFAGADLLLVEGAEPEPATAVLVLTGSGRGARSTAVAALARAFQQRVGVLVAGPLSAASSQGAIAAVRDDSSLQARVSTVDGADTPQGLIAVALALAEQAAGGAGHYGTGPGARAVVPTRS